MSLLLTLRDEIVNPNIPVSVVLRKAKILATSLSQPQLAEWLTNELTGYKPPAELPAYRILSPPLLGTFSGPFGRRVSGYGVPISLLPDYMQESLRTVPMGNPIRELEAHVDSKTDTLRHPIMVEAVMMASEVVRLTGGFVLVEMYHPIPLSLLEGMLDSVRTRFLDFLLELQGIDSHALDSESALAALPASQVAKAFSITIHGDNNFIASQSDIRDVTNHSVTRGDAESLRKSIERAGLEVSDAESLILAIRDDGDRPEKKPGPKVSNWIGSMVAKAVSGGWNVAVAVAPKILMEAVSRYYGWTS